jgi:hypothetical protein
LSRWRACLRGLEETHIQAGDNVVVMGLGPIGSMFVRLAKIYGARVIAIGRRQSQLDRAERMGANEGLIATDGVDLLPEIKALTNGRGCGYRHRGGRHPEAWQIRGAHGAARWHRQFLRRLPHRHQYQSRHQSAALFRTHL